MPSSAFVFHLAKYRPVMPSLVLVFHRVYASGENPALEAARALLARVRKVYTKRQINNVW